MAYFLQVEETYATPFWAAMNFDSLDASRRFSPHSNKFSIGKKYRLIDGEQQYHFRSIPDLGTYLERKEIELGQIEHISKVSEKEEPWEATRTRPLEQEEISDLEARL
jgi:hypothetical protein